VLEVVRVLDLHAMNGGIELSVSPEKVFEGQLRHRSTALGSGSSWKTSSLAYASRTYTPASASKCARTFSRSRPSRRDCLSLRPRGRRDVHSEQFGELSSSASSGEHYWKSKSRIKVAAYKPPAEYTMPAGDVTQPSSLVLSLPSG
jgi:hypothetical protein